MTYTQAKKYLARAERRGYVRYHSGLVTDGEDYWAINIDGDGCNGRLFGCPRIIWDADVAEEMFPAREYRRNN